MPFNSSEQFSDHGRSQSMAMWREMSCEVDWQDYLPKVVAEFLGSRRSRGTDGQMSTTDICHGSINQHPPTISAPSTSSGPEIDRVLALSQYRHIPQQHTFFTAFRVNSFSENSRLIHRDVLALSFPHKKKKKKSRRTVRARAIQPRMSRPTNNVRRSTKTGYIETVSIQILHSPARTAF